MAKRRGKRRASKTAGTKTRTKKGFPGWVRPTVSMVIGGGVGLLVSGLLPTAIAPYAPAAGVLGSKIIGKGPWGKYVATSAVLAGVTFLSYRPTVQIAASTLVGTLQAARAALMSGARETGDSPAEESGSPAEESGTVAEQSRRILREAGVR